MSKRLFDLVAAGFGVAVLLPLLLAISCAIWLYDRGPIFYRGARVGQNGRLFRIFKFRTMVVNAEKIGGFSTADGDPRITPVGRLLRKYKLDEIPQIFNVLRGEMSIVGPRPEVEYYVKMYTAEESKLLTLKPGITDWASLWNSDEGALLANEVDPEKAYLEKIRPEKIRLQLKYLKYRSLGTDIVIIAQTIYTVIGRPFSSKT